MITFPFIFAFELVFNFWWLNLVFNFSKVTKNRSARRNLFMVSDCEPSKSNNDSVETNEDISTEMPVRHLFSTCLKFSSCIKVVIKIFDKFLGAFRLQER